MRYSASEKAENIQLVEQSHLPFIAAVRFTDEKQYFVSEASVYRHGPPLKTRWRIAADIIVQYAFGVAREIGDEIEVLKDRCWVDFSRGRDEKHPLPPLRQKRETIHDAVGPTIVALLKCFDQGPHAASLVQLQHERNIFQHDPRHTPVIEQAEDFAHKARPRTPDTQSLACLAKILAWKPGLSARLPLGAL